MTDLFSRTDSWVFDLDNTLYDAESHVFVEVGNRMTDFVASHLKVPHDEAGRLRKHYYHTYGTTLRGLMSEHEVDPAHFLQHVHDIDISVVPQCDIVKEKLLRLQGRRFVFTNAPRAFAELMLAQLGIRDYFDGVFAIEDAAYWPKPKIDTYHVFLKKHGVDAKRACMFEDLEVNLRPAHELGMSTVWFHGKNVKPEDLNHPHTHHKAERLADWLQENVR
ncbi:MAG: pyrimidine 5'-nucleotidase [Micavibrio sp.]|nr:pyrimidine 5'-nucleotidase [Micavibrio sp.]